MQWRKKSRERQKDRWREKKDTEIEYLKENRKVLVRLIGDREKKN